MPRSATRATIGAVRRYVPILTWLPSYDRRWLAADALAGLSVWALLVPQSLAYATLSGVPVQYGLYTAFAALGAYPLFGTSRHLAEGPSAAVCGACAMVIAPLAVQGARPAQRPDRTARRSGVADEASKGGKDGIETEEPALPRDEPGGCPRFLARWCPAWRRREPGLRLLHGT
jgi:MFS superfamily sulfate permease-like transporter